MVAFRSININAEIPLLVFEYDKGPEDFVALSLPMM